MTHNFKAGRSVSKEKRSHAVCSCMGPWNCVLLLNQHVNVSSCNWFTVILCEAYTHNREKMGRRRVCAEWLGGSSGWVWVRKESVSILGVTQ